MDELTYNKIQETLTDVENKLHQLGRDENLFDVVVTNANGNGSKLARYIAKNFDLPLKVAADMVNSIPCTILTNLPEEMAKMIQKTIEGFGCDVSIVQTKEKA